MADFYGKMAGVASKLLTKFNQATITLVRITPGTGPVSNPGPASETLIVLTAATAKGISTRYILQNLATAGDVELTMDTSVEPNQKDAILIDGVRYKVVQIIKLPMSGTPVAYKLIIRR